MGKCLSGPDRDVLLPVSNSVFDDVIFLPHFQCYIIPIRIEYLLLIKLLSQRIK